MLHSACLSLKNRLNAMTTHPMFAPPYPSLVQPRHQPRLLIRTVVATLGLTLLSTVLMSPAAHAEDEDKAPTSGRSTGSRGCGTTVASSNAIIPAPASGKVAALILLAPSRPQEKTISTRPTFAWFVRDRGSSPLEFRIYEQTRDGYTLLKEIKDEAFRSVPGITVLSPQYALPELSPGKRYRWQVELVCNPARPSGNLFAEAEVSVIRPSGQLQQSSAQSLQGEQARLKHARMYAKANLWYDALATVLPTTQDSVAIRDFRQSLLDRIAINPAEQEMLRQSAITSTAPLVSAQQ
jgi:Domain of Unknown Function (DUF928)